MGFVGMCEGEKGNCLLQVTKKATIMKKIYFILLGITLASCANNSNVYTNAELNGLWVIEDKIGFEFGIDSTIESREFSYFSTYTIKKDTIDIVHDYGANECWTKDAAGNKIPCDDWPLPDSKFQILDITESELTLCPLNPSAMKIVGKIINPHIGYSLKSYQSLINELADKKNVESNPVEAKNIEKDDLLMFKPSSIDTLVLKSAQSFYKAIEFDSIAISSFSQGWFAQYYYDLKLFSDGRFVVKNNRYGSDKGEFEDSKIILGLFEGQLSKEETNEINNLLSSSGMPNFKPPLFGVWTSHGTEVDFKVYYNDTSMRYHDVQYSFPILIEPIIEKLLGIDEFEKYRRIDGVEQFETSFERK